MPQTDHLPSILFVEDSPADVHLMIEAMRLANMENMTSIETASNGSAALDLLHSSGHSIDLILLDLSMPKVDGKEFIARLRESGSYNTIPIIVMSNSDYGRDIVECERLGVQGYIQKPNDFDHLVSFFVAVRNSLEAHGAIMAPWINERYYKLIQGSCPMPTAIRA